LELHGQPGKNKERLEMVFAPATAIRRLREEGIATYVLFTQADRYHERLHAEWNGDLAKVLEEVLPRFHMALVETGSPCALVSAIETVRRDGRLLPKIGCKTGNLDTLVGSLDDFLIKNKTSAPRPKSQAGRKETEEQNRKDTPGDDTAKTPLPDDASATPPPILAENFQDESASDDDDGNLSEANVATSVPGVSCASDDDGGNLSEPTSETKPLPMEKPPNHLFGAIVVTLLCCLPLGIVGIVKAAKVDGLYEQGRYEEAKEASEGAQWFIWLSVIIGVFFFIIMALINNK
jgi:hypothetical protein